MQPLATNPHNGPQAPAALLFETIRQLGEQRSNPVLELLADVPSFVRGDKYPRPPLAFGDDRWRAYYHCHPEDDGSTEHGHFHLFTRSGEDWAHLAALSMDHEGQPLRWSATNGWVTGGDWADSHHLLAAVDALAPANETDSLRRWLAGVLLLYRDDLAGLLEARDARLASLARERPADEVLADRTLYELAAAPIDLAAKLISQLTGESS